MLNIQNFIGGEMTAPVSGGYFDTVDPAIGLAYAKVPDSDVNDLNLAVTAAKKAFPAWRDTPAETRAHLLEKLASLMEARKEEFIRAECIDTGKPLWLAASVDGGGKTEMRAGQSVAMPVFSSTSPPPFQSMPDPPF